MLDAALVLLPAHHALAVVCKDVPVRRAWRTGRRIRVGECRNEVVGRNARVAAAGPVGDAEQGARGLELLRPHSPDLRERVGDLVDRGRRFGDPGPYAFGLVLVGHLRVGPLQLEPTGRCVPLQRSCPIPVCDRADDGASGVEVVPGSERGSRVARHHREVGAAQLLVFHALDERYHVARPGERRAARGRCQASAVEAGGEVGAKVEVADRAARRVVLDGGPGRDRLRGAVDASRDGIGQRVDASLVLHEVEETTAGAVLRERLLEHHVVREYRSERGPVEDRRVVSGCAGKRVGPAVDDVRGNGTTKPVDRVLHHGATGAPGPDDAPGGVVPLVRLDEFGVGWAVEIGRGRHEGDPRAVSHAALAVGAGREREAGGRDAVRARGDWRRDRRVQGCRLGDPAEVVVSHDRVGRDGAVDGCKPATPVVEVVGRARRRGGLARVRDGRRDESVADRERGTGGAVVADQRRGVRGRGVGIAAEGERALARLADPSKRVVGGPADRPVGCDRLPQASLGIIGVGRRVAAGAVAIAGHVVPHRGGLHLARDGGLDGASGDGCRGHPVWPALEDLPVLVLLGRRSVVAGADENACRVRPRHARGAHEDLDVALVQEFVRQPDEREVQDARAPVARGQVAVERSQLAGVTVDRAAGHGEGANPARRVVGHRPGHGAAAGVAAVPGEFAARGDGALHGRDAGARRVRLDAPCRTGGGVERALDEGVVREPLEDGKAARIEQRVGEVVAPRTVLGRGLGLEAGLHPCDRIRVASRAEAVREFRLLHAVGERRAAHVGRGHSLGGREFAPRRQPRPRAVVGVAKEDARGRRRPLPDDRYGCEPSVRRVRVFEVRAAARRDGRGGWRGSRSARRRGVGTDRIGPVRRRHRAGRGVRGAVVVAGDPVRPRGSVAEANRVVDLLVDADGLGDLERLQVMEAGADRRPRSRGVLDLLTYHHGAAGRGRSRRPLQVLVGLAHPERRAAAGAAAAREQFLGRHAVGCVV